MSKNENLTLIEGVFSYQEAKEILLNIFSAKVNYHEKKSFSSQIRFGKEDATAQRRIPELKKEIAKLQTILSEAGKSNQHLRIHAEINISISGES